MSVFDVTEEDYTLIRDHIELPFAVEVIELNIRKVKAANLKMGELFVLYLEDLRDKMLEEAKQVRVQMRTRSITVYKQRRFEDKIEANYACRGYRGNMVIRWSKVRADIMDKLAKELGVDLAKLSE